MERRINGKIVLFVDLKESEFRNVKAKEKEDVGMYHLERI